MLIMIVFFFLFFASSLFSFEHNVKMNEIQPAFLQEKDPLIPRSDSFDSVIIHDECEKNDFFYNESLQINQSFRQRKKRTRTIPLTQNDLFELILNNDHEKIIRSHNLISSTLINQRYADKWLRPLAFAAQQNASKKVFKALFICGADPDFNDESFKNSSCLKQCYQWISCYRKKKDPPRPASARKQIRQLLEDADQRDFNNESPQEAKNLLKILRNLHIKPALYANFTWGKEAHDEAKRRGIIIPSYQETHIPIIE